MSIGRKYREGFFGSLVLDVAPIGLVLLQQGKGLTWEQLLVVALPGRFLVALEG